MLRINRNRRDLSKKCPIVLLIDMMLILRYPKNLSRQNSNSPAKAATPIEQLR